MVFFNFLNFSGICFEFSIAHRVETKRNDNFLFSLFLSLFQPILAWNEARMVFFNFFAFFLEFSVTLLVGTERNGTIIFIFSLSQPFPTCFDLKESHNGIFLIFWTFLLFYWNFLLRVVEERNGPIIFTFSLSRHCPTYFGLKGSQNGIF